MMKWMSTMAFAAVLGLAGVSFAETPTFDQVDANKDGMLSQSEVASVAKLDFAKADTNRDGMLSREEYQAAIG